MCDTSCRNQHRGSLTSNACITTRVANGQQADQQTNLARIPVDRVAEFIYFAGIAGAIPVFFVVQIAALFIFRGWTKLVVVMPGVYVGHVLFVDLGAGVMEYLHRRMDKAEFHRFLYEQWSIASRPAMVALAGLVAMILLRSALLRWRAPNRS